MRFSRRHYLFTLTFLFLILSFITSKAVASHSWGNYHWARTNNPFTLNLGDNVSTSWDQFLTTTSTDWSVSSVMDTNIVTGMTNSKNCRATNGRVEVCNNKYGKNGWLGLAQIWINGNHITQGVTKLNDSYFTTPKYNTPEWKNLVICQELGHTFGLDHQDEDFNNPPLGSCMDYSNDPKPNQHPNQHDYEELATIYQHLDGFNSIKNSLQKFPLGLSVSKDRDDNEFENRSEWGQEIKNNRRVALFKRDLSGNNKLFTFVVWAEE